MIPLLFLINCLLERVRKGFVVVWSLLDGYGLLSKSIRGIQRTTPSQKLIINGKSVSAVFRKSTHTISYIVVEEQINGSWLTNIIYGSIRSENTKISLFAVKILNNSLVTDTQKCRSRINVCVYVLCGW